VERETALVIVSADPDRTVRRLAALRSLGEYALVPRGVERFRDTYLDTPDGELGARRIALRIRDFLGTDRTLTTLKTPGRRFGTVSERGELEVSLDEAGARRVLARLQRLGIRAELPSAREFVHGEAAGTAAGELRPSQVRGNRRLLREVRRGSARVAEMAIDRVTYEIAGALVRIDEVEIEAKDRGTASDLQRLTRELLARFKDDLRPWQASKLAIGKALEGWKRRGQLSSRLTPRRTVEHAWLPRLARAAQKA